MKSLITWNVNGIRSIYKKGFLEWLKKENPDILCLQETKAHSQQLELELLEPYSYKSYWNSAEKKGYSGTATYTKKEALKITGLGIQEFDQEGRCQILHYPEFILINAYFPNSQEKGKRLDYKLSFCEAVLASANDFQKNGHHVIICGDFNIAHKPIDLKNPEANVENPGFLPEERSWMDKFIASGYIDVFRMFNKEGSHYTWWSYRTRARERNAGWRLDYYCVNEKFSSLIEKCDIMNDVMGSDHCPVKLSISQN